jgi:hypothetical protein
VFTKFLDSLRGARKVEYLALILVAALAVMLWARDNGADPGVSTALEQRMERALSAVDGAGEVSVMVTEGEDGAVIGVLIVAEGANDMAVRLALSDAAHTLLGVNSKNIEIARMRGN